MRAHARRERARAPSVRSLTPSCARAPAASHPDIFDKVWAASRGGTSKASAVVNVRNSTRR